MTMSPESTQQLRVKIRAARRMISATDRSTWSRQIGETIKGLPSFQTAQKVAGFLAFDGEADPLGLMLHALQMGKKVYVPTMVAKGEPLKFVPWTENSPVNKNRFGILEPIVPKSEWLAPRDLDFVITPLVGFDESGKRIGVGGGYYDRSFAFLSDPTSRGKSTTCLVGFAFELQKLDAIAAQPWDVALHQIVTESQVYPGKL